MAEALNLFQPVKIGKLELPNRFVRSATHDRSASASGEATDQSIELYRELGAGNIGLIVTGHAFVSKVGRAAPNQYGAHSDDLVPGLCRLADAVHQEGGKIALQLAHAGRIASAELGSQRVAVSASQGDGRHELSDDEVLRIVDDFAAAAVRARKAGFDAVQFHGAHGYLMTQFLSPSHNHRTDRWGGSKENRRRFLFEVTRKARQAVGTGFPLLVKLGVYDPQIGSASAEAVEAAEHLASAGIDAFEVSTMDPGIGAAPVRKKDDEDRPCFRQSAAQVKRAVGVPVIAVGGIRSFKTAQDIVESGDADLISMSRPFIRDPYLVAHWQAGDLFLSNCISCNRCLAVGKRDLPLFCVDEHPEGSCGA